MVLVSYLGADCRRGGGVMVRRRGKILDKRFTMWILRAEERRLEDDDRIHYRFLRAQDRRLCECVQCP